MTPLVFKKGISEISGEDISHGQSGRVKGGIKSRREMLVHYLQLLCFLGFLDITDRVVRIPFLLKESDFLEGVFFI